MAKRKKIIISIDNSEIKVRKNFAPKEQIVPDKTKYSRKKEKENNWADSPIIFKINRRIYV